MNWPPPPPAQPEALTPDIRLSEVDDGEFFAGDLFRRKFGEPPPPHGHHLVALHRDPAGLLRTLAYVHFFEFGDIILVGGGCTDGNAIRALPEPTRERIRRADGLLLHLLRYGFSRYAERCEAYFGHCGDARAEAVDLKAGFIHSGHPQLLVHWHKPLHPVIQRALLAKAVAVGAF